jgi:hypothetical protein
MDHLSWNRKDFESNGQATLISKCQGQQIEKQGSIVFGFERHQSAARARRRRFVQRLKIRSFSAERGPVIDELYRQLTVGEIKLHDDLGA